MVKENVKQENVIEPFGYRRCISAGTWAYFTDTEASTGNTLTAGTLDLTVDNADDLDVTTKVTLTGMAPCEWKEIGPINLTNVGTIDGIADLHFTNVVDSEDGVDTNGIYVGSSEPELVADSTGDIYDISTQIWVDVWYDANKDGVAEEDEVIYEDGVITLAELNDFDLGPLDAGTSADLYLSFHMKEDAGNEYQGDYTTFDIEFTLHQYNDNSV